MILDKGEELLTRRTDQVSNSPPFPRYRKLKRAADAPGYLYCSDSMPSLRLLKQQSLPGKQNKFKQPGFCNKVWLSRFV
jgi:hypothetical protein